MKLSTLFVINAVFALLGAIMLLLAPQQTMSSYGASLTKGGLFLSHILGVVILGVAIISYLARNIKDIVGLKAILTGFVVAHAGSTIVALMAVLSGTLNQMTWVDVFAHGLLAAGFGYYLTKR